MPIPPSSATGTRSKVSYEVAFDQEGRIHELNLEFTLDGGNSKDVTQHVLDLAMLSADGAYHIPRFRVDGAGYRTSRMTRTAMRTFGVTQCSLIRETAIEHVAHELGMLPEDRAPAQFLPRFRAQIANRPRPRTVKSWTTASSTKSGGVCSRTRKF